MSGRQYFKKELPGISRRSFLLQAGIITSGILLHSCIRRLNPVRQYKHIQGGLKGPDALSGHLLRDKIPLPKPTSVRKTGTLIIGSGISGLSAARWLKKQGYNDFELVELEDHAGGNAHASANSVSAYPLGAHYITIANNEDELLIDFLTECNTIVGSKDGLPVYNEYHLCFDPEERLLINGQWQEGLVPDFGIAAADRQQIKDFFRLVRELRDARGSDGRYAFTIPVDDSSKDEQLRQLDRQSFKSYLQEHQFTSPYLLWYLNYCCKDDYGQTLETVSAWAGLHYFAARRGKAANADTNAVLTWPEGNNWLVKQMAQKVAGHITTGVVCYKVTVLPGAGVMAELYDTAQKTTYTIQAEQVILATPQMVNQRILSGVNRTIDLSELHYAPWFIANITVTSLPQSKGAGLCWDNVAYNTNSVGYVNACQQQLSTVSDKKVITFYLPLCEQEPKIARLAAYTRTYSQWLDKIIPELEYMHPGITPHIEQVEGWVWGHGMIVPAVGYIWGPERQKAQLPIGDQVFFAHTDLSGISIFEEAFHQGIKAAKQVLNGK